MTAVDLNCTISLAQVSHRLEHINQFVRRVRAGEEPSRMVPLWNLRALREESGEIGCSHIPDVCRQIEKWITELPPQVDSIPQESLSAMLSASAYIRECAGRFSRGMLEAGAPASVSAVKAVFTASGGEEP